MIKLVHQLTLTILAKVILKIIMNYKTESGLFHYSNEGEISWFEFARSIRELYKLDCEIIGVSSKEFKTLAKRPQVFTFK